MPVRPGVPAAAETQPRSSAFSLGRIGRTRRRPVAVVVCCSALLPGAAHLRLGAFGDGLGYLSVVGLLNLVQFGAPCVETPAAAAASSGTAFALGWVISALAARSAARLV